MAGKSEANKSQRRRLRLNWIEINSAASDASNSSIWKRELERLNWNGNRAFPVPQGKDTPAGHDSGRSCIKESYSAESGARGVGDVCFVLSGAWGPACCILAGLCG